MSKATPNVAVVGAGVAGLTCARQLMRCGVDVRVYERRDRPGGVIHTSAADGFLREHAVNGFLGALPDDPRDHRPSSDARERPGDPADAVELCHALGVPIARAAPAARKRWIYRNGALHALPSSPISLIRSNLISWRGKLAALGEPFRGRHNGEETVLAFARRRLGDEIAEAVVAPFVTGVFAGDAGQLSLPAAFPTLAALDRDGGLVRGMIKQRRARRKQGGPRPPRQRLTAPVGGASALIDALASEVGDRLVTGAAVDAVTAGPTVRLGDGSEHRFDAVVLAVPAYVAADQVAAESSDLAELLRSIPYVSASVVHLGFRRDDIAHPLDGFGFLTVKGEPLRVLGVVFESVLWPDRAPDGHVLLRCIYGGSRDPGVMDVSDDALVATAVDDLRAALGDIGPPVHSHVVRWRRAIAQYTLGHNDRVARADQLASAIGVTLAGNGYRGVAVNRIVADASRVARAVLAQLGALAVVLACLVAIGCAGNSQPKSDKVAGQGGQPPAQGAEQGDASLAPPAPIQYGRLSVTVSWLDAPAELRRPAGRNPCGAWRRAPVRIHTLGGLADAVVWATPSAEQPTPDLSRPDPAISLARCQLHPAVSLADAGRDVVIRTDDEARQRVTVTQSGQTTERWLPIIGAHTAVAIAEPGVVRVTSGIDPDEPAYVVVPDTPHAALTNERGQARLDQLAPGDYQVTAWHRPVKPGQAPIEITRAVTIKPSAKTELSIQVKP